MQYKIEEIGASFTTKWIQTLEKKLNSSSENGYEFHSVIQIEKPWCLSINSLATTTYLAVFKKE